MYIAYLKNYLSNFEDFELFPFADRVTDANCTVLQIFYRENSVTSTVQIKSRCLKRLREIYLSFP